VVYELCNLKIAFNYRKNPRSGRREREREGWKGKEGNTKETNT
jgi:hypothetical protein